MIACIHQPDFMPWLGLFKKINNSDVWVVLNHTENNPRDAAFWCRRVKMLLNGQSQWLSLPLQKPEQPGVIGVPINKIKYNLADPKLFSKALKSIESNYHMAPFFKDVFPLVLSFFESDEILMEKRNLDFIKSIMIGLKIKTKIVYSDTLGCSSSATELLIEILKKIDASGYLCGDGASGYQKDEMFQQNGIKLAYNNFSFQEYPQFSSSTFIPGLSIVDSLMNVGFDEVKKLIQK
jgi:hypothetical protein